MVTPAALPEAAAPSHLSSTPYAPPPPLSGAQDDMAIDPPDPSLPVSGVDVPMPSGADGPAADMEVEAATPPRSLLPQNPGVTTYCAPSSTATYREEN